MGLKPAALPPCEEGTLSLNRTSVGLKLNSRATHKGISFSLNRTSVGLKLFIAAGLIVGVAALNRTSVGLKRIPRTMMMIPRSSPQSNQRGIETSLNEILRRLIDTLNRTSVGLKLTCASPPATLQRCPQSNQRGIETRPHPSMLSLRMAASIEPAWD